MRPTTLTLFDASFLASTEASVSPTTFGQPTRWWDANSLEYLTNDALIGVADPWDDQSPNDMDATATNGHEPVFKSSIINGRPIVRMQGTRRMLFAGGDLFLDNFTILAVIKSANDSIFVSRNGGSSQVRSYRNGVNTASWFSGESGTELVSNVFSSNPSDARMVGYRRSDNASTPDRRFVFFDNSTQVIPSSGVGGVSNILFPVNQIGIADGGPLNIDIAELIIYDSALTTSNIQLLYHSYFKPKFLLP